MTFPSVSLGLASRVFGRLYSVGARSQLLGTIFRRHRVRDCSITWLASSSFGSVPSSLRRFSRVFSPLSQDDIKSVNCPCVRPSVSQSMRCQHFQNPKGVFIATQLNWTQLNSTDPVEQRTAKSMVFCLWRHDLQTELLFTLSSWVQLSSVVSL